MTAQTEVRISGFVNAPRIHTALTAGVEKRLLTWLARRTPSGIGPDHLTALGFAAQLLAGGAYALAAHDARALWLVNAFLFLNWLGDSLDGTLARVRNRQRPRYGFYVDHITDAFGTLFLVGGMGLSGYMHPMVSAMLLVAYFLLSIQTYLATYALGTFQLSHWKFSPTELRVLLAVGNIAVLFWPMGSLFGHRFPLFDVGGVAGIAGMCLMAIVASIRNTAALYRAERLPPM